MPRLSRNLVGPPIASGTRPASVGHQPTQRPQVACSTLKGSSANTAWSSSAKTQNATSDATRKVHAAGQEIQNIQRAARKMSVSECRRTMKEQSGLEKRLRSVIEESKSISRQAQAALTDYESLQLRVENIRRQSKIMHDACAASLRDSGLLTKLQRPFAEQNANVGGDKPF